MLFLATVFCFRISSLLRINSASAFLVKSHQNHHNHNNHPCVHLLPGFVSAMMGFGVLRARFRPMFTSVRCESNMSRLNVVVKSFFVHKNIFTSAAGYFHAETPRKVDRRHQKRIFSVNILVLILCLRVRVVKLTTLNKENTSKAASAISFTVRFSDPKFSCCSNMETLTFKK